MQIGKDSVVTIDYTLSDNDGNVLDSSKGGDPLAYLHGANNIIPGLENALVGKVVDDELTVGVEPAEAYGERSEDLVQVVPSEMFGDAEIKMGEHYHAAGPNGEQLSVTVVKVDDKEVTVDGNHPLAGVALNFDVKIIDIRNATEEELAHGHVHGPGGHVHG